MSDKKYVFNDPSERMVTAIPQMDTAESITNRNNMFRKELAEVINRHNQEWGPSTPDFILADYLIHCLRAYTKATVWNKAWHSEDGVPQAWREFGPQEGDL